MPRIPEEVIERLKSEVSLERLAEARGVKLTKHGSDLRGLCPFHDDHEPSLVVSPKKNLWHRKPRNHTHDLNARDQRLAVVQN
jgi:DNA primase